MDPDQPTVWLGTTRCPSCSSLRPRGALSLQTPGSPFSTRNACDVCAGSRVRVRGSGPSSDLRKGCLGPSVLSPVKPGLWMLRALRKEESGAGRAKAPAGPRPAPHGDRGAVPGLPVQKGELCLLGWRPQSHRARWTVAGGDGEATGAQAADHPARPQARRTISPAGRLEEPQKQVPLNTYAEHLWTCLHRRSRACDSGPITQPSPRGPHLRGSDAALCPPGPHPDEQPHCSPRGGGACTLPAPRPARDSAQPSCRAP